MEKLIRDKVKSLKIEMDSINDASNSNNMKITKFEKKRNLELRAKIQVLTEIVLTTRNL
jgi:hypothetical protein